MIETEPELPEGYSWQFVDGDGVDCTSRPLYAVEDAVYANIWCENGDMVLWLERASGQADWSVRDGLPGHEWVASLDAAVTLLSERDALAVS